ncbi:MAG: CBS domain-containing protein [Spirochaetes bacterium]|nr:CBS domain-containing protein [Spirochaetota bacterium]
MKSELFVSTRTTVKEALKKLDRTAQKVLLVVDEKDRLLGTLSDGDIRRYILKGEDLDCAIETVYNTGPISVTEDELSPDLVKELLIENKIELLPILDANGRVTGYRSWSDVFGEKAAAGREKNPDIPVVIMAGGRGARLEPFTRILPKPLIPVGEKPIIEMIIDEFYKQGLNRYFLTINYKGEMIKSYFDNEPHEYELFYFKEKDFLGTAGGLKLLEDEIDELFFVSNCDVIVKFDIADVLRFHKERSAALTVLSSIQHHKIPYGVVHYQNGGEVTEISEKPEFTFTINTGVYLLSKRVLKFIPKNTRYDMTGLIQDLTSGGEKVITYPVNENDYIDIGQWEEYKKSISKLEHL